MPWWTVCLLSVNIGTFHCTVQTSIFGAYLTISGLRLFHWLDSYFDIPVDFAINVIHYMIGDRAVPPKSLNRLTALCIGQIWIDHIVCKRNAPQKVDFKWMCIMRSDKRRSTQEDHCNANLNENVEQLHESKMRCFVFIICSEKLPPATSSIFFFGGRQTLCLIGWLIPGLPGSEQDRPRILACNSWHCAKVFFFFFFFYEHFGVTPRREPFTFTG